MFCGDIKIIYVGLYGGLQIFDKFLIYGKYYVINAKQIKLFAYFCFLMTDLKMRNFLGKKETYHVTINKNVILHHRRR